VVQKLDDHKHYQILQHTPEMIVGIGVAIISGVFIFVGMGVNVEVEGISEDVALNVLY